MNDASPAEAVFAAALEKTDPTERARFLEEACAGNLPLRAQVERLLAAHEKAGNFLRPPDSTGAYVTASAKNVATGMIVAGKYKLLQQIGEGGMGSVWMADQTEPVKRRVAVKLIRVERGQSKTVLSRFEAERQAIALMDHPNIAKLLDAGTTDDGSPFFVMELVKGVPLTDFCDAHRLSVPARLQLFMQVCSAVQHAHQKGVIHRDLKPSNVLVEDHDGRGVPKVIDFGLAKATTGLQLTDKTLFTAFGSVMGTPLYMAPEQANFSALDVDTRADVYALGVILYELLTGTTPITRETIKEAQLDEMLKLIREQDAPTPSSRLSSLESAPSVAANRQSEPAKLSRFVKGELDWIVLKALAKERDRRYETANGFAKDVERFLNQEPVTAGPPTARYKLRKFVQRNRGQVFAVGLVFLALVAGIAGTTLGLIEAKRQERIAFDEMIAKEIARKAESEQRIKAEKARDRTRDVLDAMTSSVTGYSLATQTAVGEDQKKFLTEVLTFYREFAGEKADDEQSRARSAAAAYRVGYIENRLGRSEQALVAFRTARDSFAKLATDFPANAEYRYELARSLNNMGLHLRFLGKQSEAADHHRQALAIGDKLVPEVPTVSKYRRELAGFHGNLGHLVTTWPEREEHYRKALAINEKLVADSPADPDYRRMLGHSHNNLGQLLENLRRLPEAEEHFRKNLSIREKLHAEFPAMPEYRHELAGALCNLANLMSDLGKRLEAKTELQKAVVLLEKLTVDFPADPEYQRFLAGNLIHLGVLTVHEGKPEASEAQIRKALTIQEKLAVDFQVVPRYRQELAIGLANLAGLMTELGRRSEAEAEHYKALAVLEKLTVDFPTEPEYLRLLADGHNRLAILLQELGKNPLAEEHYRKAMAIRLKLAAESPTLSTHQIALGGSYCNLGMAIRDGGRPSESLEWFDNAIRTLQPVHDKEPRDVGAKQFLRNSHSNRAIAYDRLQKFAEAVKDYDRVIELSPPAELLGYRAARASSRVQAGMIAEAVAEVAELTKTPNWYAAHWYNFACVYAVASSKTSDKRREYADRAMELLRQAVKAGHNDAAYIKKDADLTSLRDREDFKKLLAELEAKSTPPKEPAATPKKPTK